ncbi:alkaline phosphatase family protein [Sinimarinibacterium sp. NLF-5-8]|uniref:alkaline phosphatase family protein n=1 Tax=Sinimarinibacterium sp. NLF-5-8 TaxID=2698684 RepID=UPI00137C2559|nr:alkaline phosphatase family protein [Sinimarinibacterium sp. NLF-5-8]QHS10450.1 hypothetical protein GT972_10125 [Sinimarinibacterium sp. NLF-5-8]
MTPPLTRREFLAAAAATAANPFVLSGCDSARAPLPDPQDSEIDHVVVVMMENRSFDHFLGWVPGADGIQDGLTFIDRKGQAQSTRDLAPNFQSCDSADPEHSFEAARTHFNNGRMDGFLLTQAAGDQFPIGYYGADSLPFYKGCADHWTICDRYFSGFMGPTTPNRIYMHAGQTDRISNTVDLSTLPTVWDRMLAAGQTVAHYYTDVSYLTFWGDQYKAISHKYTLDSFADDIARNGLANLTYIDNVGNVLNAALALSMDDHPYADIRNGQSFLNHIYEVLRAHPQWQRTLLIINYDEWGGFYDHVTPPLAPISEAEAALGNDGRLGFRVPCVLIGPRARRGYVEHTQFDPNSILNFLAWRFGFEPLGARADSNNLALALDFDSPARRDAPAFNVPDGRFGGVCLPTSLLGNSQSPLPLPIGQLPLPPLPIRLPQLPPIPGFDIPLPGLMPSAEEEAARRQLYHDHDLNLIRALGQRFGF